MHSLADIDRLLSFGAWRLRRQEAALLRLRQRRAQVLGELSALAGQEDSLRALLASHRAGNCRLDHWQLLETLRRQAVIRRQLQIVALERQPLAEQRVQLDQEMLQGQQALQRLQHQQSRCAALHQRLRRELWQAQSRRDEREVDELIEVRR